jgi:capsular exopolysaccharide synthesis family protein
MSQIFDAILRSEAERTGKDLNEEPAATELLKRAENRVSAEPSVAHGNGSNGIRTDDRIRIADSIREAGVVVESPTASTENGAAAVDLEFGRPQEYATLRWSVPSQSRLVCLPGSESAAAEAFKLLGVRLRHLRRARPLKRMLITSTIPQEGKSMVAANLACTLAARTQQRVLLLEGDLRRPTQSKVFGFDVKRGICDWLHGDSNLMECIYLLERLNVCILPAGSAKGNSLELLQSGRLTEMMDQLSASFDWIVIDSPPTLPLADTSVWTNLADGILLVVRQGTTQRKQLRKGVEAIPSQKLIGVVLNSSKNASKSDYYYRPEDRSSKKE